MKAFFSYLWVQLKMDLRDKGTLLNYCLVPLVFFFVMGAVFSSINPLMKTTLAASMTIFAATMGAVMGSPTPIVKMRESGTLRAFKVNGIPGWAVLSVQAISTFVHLFLVSVIIYVVSPFAFHSDIPQVWGLYFVVLTIFLLASIGTGLLIGVVSRGQSFATMFSMYGALIIYPSRESLLQAGIYQDPIGRWWHHNEILYHIPRTATNRNFAYNDVNTFFDKEYVMLLSDIDSVWHDSVMRGISFKAANYKPDFWLVNGRAFPDTLLRHPQTPSPGSDPDLAQINYESYVHINTGQKFLLRMINLGYQPVPWHIHGWHFTIVGKDAHPSPFLKIAEKLRMDSHEAQAMGFTVNVASGETYDLVLTADDKRPVYRNYIVNGQDDLPSLCSQMRALQEIDPGTIADIPVDPVKCPTPATVNYVDICDGTQGVDRFFPQFYPMHNHGPSYCTSIFRQ